MHPLRLWATPRRQAQGFTVLELLMALSLLAVMLLVAFTVFSGPFRAWLSGRKLADEQHNARLVLEWTTRRLRMAGWGVPVGTEEYFTQAATDSVTFLANIDGMGGAEPHRFCIDADGGVVREQIGATVTASCATGAPLTSRGVRPLKVVLLQFAYFNGRQEPLSPLPLTQDQRPGVAWVRIVLGLDSDGSGAYGAASDLTFTTDVRVRN